MEKTSISFYGGAQEVTGACYLLEAAGKKILIDCGLFQGSRFADEKNKEPFPFDPKKIDALVVTHGHIDHIGRIPKLYRDGFRGPIYATRATCDLMEVMLEDAFFLMSKECRDHQEECLYFEEHFRGVKELFRPVEYYQTITLSDELSFSLLNAGHILGSSFARFVSDGKIILFTGDVGARASVLLPPHDEVRDANVLVIESAYGNRTHKHIAEKTLLFERALEDIVRKKGTLLIPVFATERTQDILYEINEMLEFRRIPPMPVFLDSPLAIKVTEVFKRHTMFYTDKIKEELRTHKHLFDFKHLTFSETKEDSKKINDVPPPKVVLAGSGMMTGGRILHHAMRYLRDPNSILLIVGWQAAGSLGRRLLDHATDVKIRGEIVPVRAEIRVIDGYSAHADQDELLAFVAHTRDSLKKVFVVQGEADAAMHLTETIQDQYGIEAHAPRFGEKFDL
ncbi:MAG: MBL fold metallo-hydrolase [bacterium]|nr:MBL fold metallo-hydrolase [bacterium]